MTLTQLNKQDILNTFNSLNGFNKAIDEFSVYLEYNDRLMLQNIKLYYNNVFDMDVSMVDDVRYLSELAETTVARLTKLHSRKPALIYKFLIERISNNIQYVSTIKKLA
ncbi:hypothetical protein [Seonamhaeicola sp.]|uniref:hypothetical protein n=1 Tax=Seonamhaeicola sp. TaxID=1912245 RepID=UPI0035690C1E